MKAISVKILRGFSVTLVLSSVGFLIHYKVGDSLKGDSWKEANHSNVD